MKRVIILAFVCVMILSSVSADIIFENEPNEIYNLGDVVEVPVKIYMNSDYTGNLHLHLLCQGKINTFYINGVDLEAGESKDYDASLILNEESGALVGDCKIRANLGDDFELTEEFKVSNSVTIQTNMDSLEYDPGESVIVKGNAFKENGEDFNGFMELEFSGGNGSESMEKLSTVSNGYFSINITLPEDIKSGNHVVRLNAYDTNSDEEKINTGSANFNINVNQIPTSLEIFIDEKNVEPGETLRTKAILHDQAGDSIDSRAIITIKKSKNEIVEQIETATDEFVELDIEYNEPAGNWSVVGVSNMLDAENTFNILEKEEVDIGFANGTVVLTNKGNVPYNDSVVVKIGENSTLDLDVFLEVDEVKSYRLNAPDGEYLVEVISDGESKFQESVLLTGRAVDIRELGASGRGLIKIIAWIFIILVLCFVAYMVYRKGYRKSFFGSKKKESSKVDSKKESQKKETPKSKGQDLVDTSNKAFLSLSIKGDKHDSSVVCLKLKNFKNIKKEGVEDSFKKIVHVAESKKASIYENNENVFFIFSALKTKTFKDEKDALELAQKVKEILDSHNKLFKQKVDYGISVNNGSLVAKVNEDKNIEFMAMGNLISSSRKIASLSSGEVLVSKDFKDKAGALIKSEEKDVEGHKVYIIKEVRDREQHAKFISNFLHGLERDKKEKERRDSKKEE